MSKVVDIDIKEYKKIRYIVIPNNNWGYGYILIDKKIFDDLKLKWNDNHTSYTDGCITWIQNRELGDKDFPGQKENLENKIQELKDILNNIKGISDDTDS